VCYCSAGSFCRVCELMVSCDGQCVYLVMNYVAVRGCNSGAAGTGSGGMKLRVVFVAVVIERQKAGRFVLVE